MDWQGAIEVNKAALLRIVAMMFALSGAKRGARDVALPRDIALLHLAHLAQHARGRSGGAQRVSSAGARDLQPATLK